MICRVSYTIGTQRASITVIAKTTIDALLEVMETLNLKNGIVTVLKQ